MYVTPSDGGLLLAWHISAPVGVRGHGNVASVLAIPL